MCTITRLCSHSVGLSPNIIQVCLTSTQRVPTNYGFVTFQFAFFAGGHIAFFGTVNAFVHMIMYSYYLITALHFVDSKSLWWKKYITQLQLVINSHVTLHHRRAHLIKSTFRLQIQFVITGLHAITALVQDCNFPKFIIAFGIPQDILMIVLFLDFYRKTYSKKSTESGAKEPIKSE